jgi:subtilisin-like proprotein convertase family protein
MSLPTDPLFAQQWHLLNTGQSGGPVLYDLNVADVWDDYTGRGVTVGVIDSGIDPLHPDIDANYAADTGFEAAYGSSRSSHGTAVAGLIAAEAGNGLGGTGVAPDAGILGFRAIGAGGSFNAMLEAMRRQVDVDVSNNSWSYETPFVDDLQAQGFRDFAQAMSDVVAYGRDGLGTSLVFAAGNRGQLGGDANYHGITSSRFGIAVGAVEADGAISGYSTPGASVLVSAFGSGVQGDIVSTDVTGAEGSDPGDYTGSFNGTSASAPMVSGIVALMLEANPHLGYRDVQEILASSARQTGPVEDCWQINGAGTWNGGGLHVSHQYGYGLVDAHAAVRLAETWTGTGIETGTDNETVTGQHTAWNEYSLSASSTPGLWIPDLGSVTDAIAIDAPQDLRIDHVEVDLGIAHSWVGDLTVTLTSPSGTYSVLAARPGAHAGQSAGIQGDGGIHFTTTSTQHWGENGNGTWTLEVRDGQGYDVGVLEDWTLRLYGDLDTGDDRFVFTDEYAAMAAADPLRSLLSDEGGTDTFNAAAVTSDMVIDLRPGAQSQVAGAALTIGAGTTIENVFGGDGADLIVGNAAANEICGGRGDDVLYGDAGQDRFVFAPDCGLDAVMDFTAASGAGDILDLRDFDLADPVTVWSQFQDTPDGALLALSPDDAVLLGGVSMSELSMNDFWI